MQTEDAALRGISCYGGGALRLHQRLKSFRFPRWQPLVPLQHSVAAATLLHIILSDTATSAFFVRFDLLSSPLKGRRRNGCSRCSLTAIVLPFLLLLAKLWWHRAARHNFDYWVHQSTGAKEVDALTQSLRET